MRLAFYMVISLGRYRMWYHSGLISSNLYQSTDLQFPLSFLYVCLAHRTPLVRCHWYSLPAIAVRWISIFVQLYGPRPFSTRHPHHHSFPFRCHGADPASRIEQTMFPG